MQSIRYLASDKRFLCCVVVWTGYLGKQRCNGYIKVPGNLLKSTDAHAILPAFVFLKLLRRYFEGTSQVALRGPQLLPSHPNSFADFRISLLNRPCLPSSHLSPPKSKYFLR